MHRPEYETLKTRSHLQDRDGHTQNKTKQAFSHHDELSCAEESKQGVGDEAAEWCSHFRKVLPLACVIFFYYY